MNQNLKEDSDEKNVRKLFGEMRHQDELAAPTFAAVSQLTSNSEVSVRIGRILPIAAAIVVMILVCTAAIVYFRKPIPQRTGLENRGNEEQGADIKPKSFVPENAANPPVPRPTSHRPRIKAPRRTDLLISRWRSPTEFLLRTPGNELLRIVPRLDDSRLKFNAAMPNDSN
jgi:hypothetical protein